MVILMVVMLEQKKGSMMEKASEHLTVIWRVH